jgi:uncharacterized repeat protein (TIGR03803 family)
MTNLRTLCTLLISVVGTAILSPAQKFKSLVDFDYATGAYPSISLIQGTDGNLYGETDNGGSSNACTNGCGTVFKITAGGTLETLHSFEGTDGESPDSLIQSTGGDFYGTTGAGGPNGDGAGTVFKITSTGKLTTLYSFSAGDGERSIRADTSHGWELLWRNSRRWTVGIRYSIQN